MICKFKIDYHQNIQITEEFWERVRAVNPTIKPLKWEEKEGEPRKLSYSSFWETYHGDIRPLLSMGLKLEVESGLDSTDRAIFYTRLMEKLESMEQRLVAQHVHLALGNGPAQDFNSRCQVVVPSMGLLQINEIKLEEDCCTDHLRDLIEDDGWRILAICPQPDQRRPDYVLGRTK